LAKQKKETRTSRESDDLQKLQASEGLDEDKRFMRTSPKKLLTV
jgi:hypothetical protein